MSSNLENLINKMKNAKCQKTGPQESLQYIIELQPFLRFSIFKSFDNDLLMLIFKEIWLYLFYMSNFFDNSSIRLSTIRTTALFIFRLFPFFPAQFETVFVNVITEHATEEITSTVVVPSFVILSYHHSPLFQNAFDISCPIFRHFSEKYAKEYFATTLLHLGHLSVEWHQSIVKNLLSKIFDEDNFDYWKLLMNIISTKINDLIFSMIFEAMTQYKDQSSILSFYSQLFRITQVYHNNANLFPIAKIAFDMISSNSTPISKLTASLEILSIETNSFNVKTNFIDDDKVEIQLLGENNIVVKEVDVKHLLTIPAFYDINLPINFLFPNDDDGCTIVSAKLRNLILHLNDCQHYQRIFDILVHYINKPYDSFQSACYKALSSSLPKIPDFFKIKGLFGLIKRDFFLNDVYDTSLSTFSWFKSLELLKIVECYTSDYLIKKLKKSNELNQFFTILIKLSKVKNETLYTEAQSFLSYFLSYEKIVKLVINECDVFDSLDLQRTLQILEKSTCFGLNVSFVFTVLDVFNLKMYETDLLTLSAIYDFFSKFQFNKLRSTTLHSALPVLSGTYYAITGIPWTIAGTSIPSDVYEKQQKLMVDQISTEQLDIITHNIFGYTSFTKAALSCLKMLKTIKDINANTVYDIIDHMFIILPDASTDLMITHLSKFPMTAVIFFLKKYTPFIFYIHGHEFGNKWCYLIQYILSPNNHKLQQTVKKLYNTLEIMRNYLSNSFEKKKSIPKNVMDTITQTYLTINSSFRTYIKSPKGSSKSKSQPDDGAEDDEEVNEELSVLSSSENSDEGNNSSLNTNKTFEKPERRPSKTKNIAIFDSEIKFPPPKVLRKRQLKQKYDLTDCIIITQLKFNLYKFSENELLKLYDIFNKQKNKDGLSAISKYVKKNELAFSKPAKLFKTRHLTLQDLQSEERIEIFDIKNFVTYQMRKENPETIISVFCDLLQNETDAVISSALINLISSIVFREKKINQDLSIKISNALSVQFHFVEKNEKYQFLSDSILICTSLIARYLSKDLLPIEMIKKFVFYTPSGSYYFPFFIMIQHQCFDLTIENLSYYISQLLNTGLPHVFINSSCLFLIAFAYMNKFSSSGRSRRITYNRPSPNNSVPNPVAVNASLDKIPRRKIDDDNLNKPVNLPKQSKNVVMNSFLNNSEALNQLFSTHYHKFSDNFHIFKDNEIIQKYIIRLFTKIFQTPNLGYVQSIIISNLQLWLQQSQRNFFYSSRLCPKIISASKTSHISLDLKSFPSLKQLFVSPYINSYFNTINELAPSYAMDKRQLKATIDEFINDLQSIERVKVPDCILRFYLFLNKFYPVSKCIKILINVKPFTCVFSATSRFLKTQPNNILDSISFLYELQCKAHSKAFQIALEHPSMIKKAFKLSEYEQDCEESEKLIQSIDSQLQESLT